MLADFRFFIRAKRVYLNQFLSHVKHFSNASNWRSQYELNGKRRGYSRAELPQKGTKFRRGGRDSSPSGGAGGSFRGSENRLLGAVAPSVGVKALALRGEWVENFAKRNPPLGAQAPKFREVRLAPRRGVRGLRGLSCLLRRLWLGRLLRRRRHFLRTCRRRSSRR